MPIRSSALSVGSNPLALASNSWSHAAARITVFNMGGAGSGIVYVGGDQQVRPASGLPVPSNSSLVINTAGSTAYAVSNEQYQTVRILEEY